MTTTATTRLPSAEGALTFDVDPKTFTRYRSPDA